MSWVKDPFTKRMVPVGRTSLLDEISIHSLYHIVINVNELVGFNGNWYKCHSPGVYTVILLTQLLPLAKL
jgi:hypothetical protein